MNRKEQISFGILGLLIAACGCIAAWLAAPQLQQMYSSPTRATPSPSNTPLVITFSPSENSPMPTIANSPTETFTPSPTPVTPTDTPTYTPTNTSTYTPTPIRNSSILVFVYWDGNNDGWYTAGDDHLLDATLALYSGSSCSGTVLAEEPGWFRDLQAGTYCVKVVNDPVENPWGCAVVPRLGRNTKVYPLKINESYADTGSEELGHSGFPYVCQ